MRGAAFRGDIEEYRRIKPDLCSRPVPTGLTRLFVHAIGWPSWVWEGTSLDRGGSLPARISLQDDLVLWANMATRLGKAELIRMTCSMPRLISSPRTALIFAAPSIGDALKYVTQLSNLANPQLRFWLEEQDEMSAIRIVCDPALGSFGDFLNLTALLYLVRVVRMIAGIEYTPGSDAFPVAIQIIDDQDLLAGELAALLSCKVKPAGRAYMIEFPSTMLAKSNPTRDGFRWAEAQAEMKRLMTEEADDSISLSARALIAEALVRDGRVPRLGEVAGRLAMSERTLARKLSLQRASFAQIVSDCRKEQAQRLLSSGRLTVDDIAHLLGFNDSSSFVRSFKVWFGTSPGIWRRQDNEKAEAPAKEMSQS